MKHLKILIFFLSVFILVLFSCNTKADTGSGKETPQNNRVMLFSSNWGDDSIKITDNILSYSDSATAIPRDIEGAATTINNPDNDSLAVDRNRGILYLVNSGDGNILVYNNLKTVEGNVAPDRILTIDMTGADDVTAGIAVDSQRDILYVGGYGGTYRLWILKDASTLSGSVAPDVTLNGNVRSLFIDESNNRLYAGSDAAAALTDGAVADRSITLNDNIEPVGLWVQSNRLYVCDSIPSTGGNYLFIFNNASTMSGTYDPDTDSVARISVESICLMIDHKNNLYSWWDSAHEVNIFYNASTLSGDIATPDKTVIGVVDRGYGMSYLAY